MTINTGDYIMVRNNKQLRDKEKMLGFQICNKLILVKQTFDTDIILENGLMIEKKDIKKSISQSQMFNMYPEYFL